MLVWLGVVYMQRGNDTLMGQWVYDSYAKKTAIAMAIDAKKIVIVSGSNALFGIDSGVLQEAFDMPVVNFGVNAGVMLPYTLYRAKSVIKSGDTVLMPLEFDMYSYDGVPSVQMIDYIYARDMHAFYALSFKEQFYMVWNITFGRVYDGYMSKGGKPVRVGLYGAHHIDGNGDQINTQRGYKSEAMQDELDALDAHHYGAEYDSDALGWEYLEEFVLWCEEKGAKVIFMPSTLMYFDSYKRDEKERWFYENLANEVRKKGWSYVGEPYEYMYDKEFYLNTDFHLIDSGRKIRTQQMILDLKGYGLDSVSSRE